MKTRPSVRHLFPASVTPRAVSINARVRNNRLLFRSLPRDWRALEIHAKKKRQPADLREGVNNALNVVRDGVADTAVSIARAAQEASALRDETLETNAFNENIQEIGFFVDFLADAEDIFSTKF